MASIEGRSCSRSLLHPATRSRGVDAAGTDGRRAVREDPTVAGEPGVLPPQAAKRVATRAGVAQRVPIECHMSQAPGYYGSVVNERGPASRPGVVVVPELVAGEIARMRRRGELLGPQAVMPISVGEAPPIRHVVDANQPFSVRARRLLTR
jgi:hypothetical protein